MQLRYKILIAVAVALIIVNIAFFSVLPRFMASIVLMSIIGYLVIELHDYIKNMAQQKLEHAKLKNICDDLDENTKLIVKTDLELTKTQEELDKKIRGLYILQELGKSLSSTLNIDELLNLVKDALYLKLEFEKNLIVIFNHELNKIISIKGVGFDDTYISDFTSRKWDLTQLNSIEPTLIYRTETVAVSPETPLKQTLMKLFNQDSMMFAPITLKRGFSGFIFAGNDPPYDKLDKGDLELVSILSSQLAVAYENAELYDEIKRSHAQLEEKVKDRTKELAKANEELKQLNKLKSDFVSNVSHELRTPLTSIKGYAALILDEKLGKITPEQRDRLARINKHSDNLIRLINNLLDIARIESGRINIHPSNIYLEILAKEISESISPQLEEKKIKLKIECQKPTNPIFADEDQIRQVIINLLSNAIRYTPVEGFIAITVTDFNNRTEFSIKDSGIGMTKEDCEQIFQEFYRVDNAINAEKIGTGLGLSLVKQIIISYNGKIWAESELNKGATFTFSLPRHPANKDS